MAQMKTAVAEERSSATAIGSQSTGNGTSAAMSLLTRHYFLNVFIEWQVDGK